MSGTSADTATPRWVQPPTSVDVVPVRLNKATGETTVILAKRIFEPFINEMALPGVILDAERVREAAYRALKVKANLDKSLVTHLIDVGVSDNPDRDPRGPTLSVVMLAILDGDVDLKEEAIEVPLKDISSLKLPFDHNNLIFKAIGHLASGLFEEKTITKALLGETFRSSDAQRAQTLLSKLTGHVETENSSNFSRKLRHTGWVEQKTTVETPSEDTKRPRGRPSALWIWK